MLIIAKIIGENEIQIYYAMHGCRNLYMLFKYAYSSGQRSMRTLPPHIGSCMRRYGAYDIFRVVEFMRTCTYKHYTYSLELLCRNNFHGTPIALCRGVQRRMVLVVISFVLLIFFFCSSPEPSCSQGELMVYSCSGVCPSFVRLSTIFKDLLWANQIQRRGNEGFYKRSRSHDQDGRHDHIW